MRLTVNVATRPFVNRTPQAILLIGLAIAAAGFTAWNVARIVNGLAETKALEHELSQLASDEQRLRDQASHLERELAQVELAPLVRQADAANEVLAQKALSWSLLLERLEELLPWRAALRTVTASVTSEGTELRLKVRARSQDEALAFIDTLEASPCFADVYPDNEVLQPTGEVEMELRALHDPWCGQAPELPSGVILRGARRGGRRG